MCLSVNANLNAALSGNVNKSFFGLSGNQWCVLVIAGIWACCWNRKDQRAHEDRKDQRAHEEKMAEMGYLPSNGKWIPSKALC